MGDVQAQTAGRATSPPAANNHKARLGGTKNTKPPNLLSLPAGRHVGFELVKAVLPCVISGSPFSSPEQPHRGQGSERQREVPKRLGLGLPFLPLFPFYPKQRSRSQRGGLRWGEPCPPPSPPFPACPSVCPSVRPRLAATAAPLPGCVRCPKRFPLPGGAHGGAREPRGRSARRPRLAGAGGRHGERPGTAPAAAGCGNACCPNKLQTSAFWGKAPMAPRARWFLLRALGTPDAAQLGTPRSRQLDGFHLLPLHLIFARLQAANCSPVAWPASVLLHEPGFIRARLTPRGWDVMGEAGNLLSCPAALCTGLEGISYLPVALCPWHLPLAGFLESAGDLGPSSKAKFPRIPPKLHMDEW